MNNLENQQPDAGDGRIVTGLILMMTALLFTASFIAVLFVEGMTGYLAGLTIMIFSAVFIMKSDAVAGAIESVLAKWRSGKRADA